MTAANPRYLLICNTSDGLVAQINGVVVQLQLARRLGLVPIVSLHKRSYMFGGPNPYFDAAVGPNVWDYFFEPIGPSGPELDALVKAGRVVTLSTGAELVRLFRWAPQSWFMNPYGYYRSVENRADGAYPKVWWNAERDKARAFLDDGTMRFKPAIIDQVDRFVAKNFSEVTLGLQLRGSDKFDFGVGPNLSRKVTPEEYYPYIDRYLAEHPKCSRIFVATDQRQWLKTLESAYPGKVVSFSQWSLSDSSANNFNEDAAKAARGVEVVVDLLLLSRCDYLIKCHAAVGEMALVVSPKLDFVDLNYETQGFDVKSRIWRPALAPAIAFLCWLWRVLSEGGLGLERVATVNGEDVRVGASRALNTKTDAKAKAPRAPMFSARFVSDAFDWLLRNLSSACLAYTKRGDAS